MKRSACVSVLAALIAVFAASSTVFAMRDPIGYADGMGLYEYVRSRPVHLRDPNGQRMYPDDTFNDNPHYIDEMERRAQWGPDPRPPGYHPTGMVEEFVEDMAGVLPLESICDKAMDASMVPARVLYEYGCDRGLQGQGEIWGGDASLNAEAYLPLVYGAGPGAGVGLGIQLIVFCDSCQYCCFFYGKVKVGVGGGAAAGASGSPVHGIGASQPEDYTGDFGGVEVSVGPLFGGGAWGTDGPGGDGSGPGTGGGDQRDGAAAGEGGVQYGAGQAVSVTAKQEYYKLIKCRDLYGQ